MVQLFVRKWHVANQTLVSRPSTDLVVKLDEPSRHLCLLSSLDARSPLQRISLRADCGNPTRVTANNRKRKPVSTKTASSSRVSIEEGLIRISAGGQSTAFEPTGGTPTATDGASEEAGAPRLERRGLSITSEGTANFSSSEVRAFEMSGS